MTSRTAGNRRNMVLKILGAVVLAGFVVFSARLASDAVNIREPATVGALVAMYSHPTKGWSYGELDPRRMKLAKCLYESTPEMMIASFAPGGSEAVGMGSDLAGTPCGGYGLRIVDLKSGSIARCSTSAYICDQPDWSDRNSLVAYVAKRNGDPNGRLAILDITSRTEKTYDLPGYSVASPVWLRNSDTLVMMGQSRNEVGLFAFCVGTEEFSRIVIPESGKIVTTKICISPNGRSIAFGGFLGEEEGLYVYDRDTHKIKQLLAACCREASYSNSGDTIAFTDRTNGKDQIGIYCLSTGKAAKFLTKKALCYPQWIRVANGTRSLPADSLSAYRQKEDNTCGLSAVTYLLHRQGVAVPQEDVAGRGASPGKDGYSLLQLKDLLGTFNIRSDGFKCNYEELRKMRMPCILFVSAKKHYVTVIGASRDSVNLFDPSQGLRLMSREELKIDRDTLRVLALL